MRIKRALRRPRIVMAGLITVAAGFLYLSPAVNFAQGDVCGPDWKVVDSPDASDESWNALLAVDAVGTNDVWAAGSVSSKTLIEHWDGTNWSVVTSPNMPQSAASNYLHGISGTGPDDAWAVGHAGISSRNVSGIPPTPFKTLITHWNGSAWTVVTSPSKQGQNNHLYAVDAVASDDVWAVGDAGDAPQTLVLHWDGTAWTSIPSPNVTTSGDYLYGVSAVSSDDVWAVGTAWNGTTMQSLTLHWDGTAWTMIESPNVGVSANTLYAVDARATDDVWAVGTYNDLTQLRSVLLHWDGTAWSVASSDVPGPDDRLVGVTARGANDVWVAGTTSVDDRESAGDHTKALIGHWDGTDWTTVDAPDAERSTLFGISMTTGGEIWTVGRIENSTHTQRACPAP